MNDNSLPGLGKSSLPQPAGTFTEHVMVQRPLHRIFAFTRRNIHDVINNSIARNEVIGFYKLHRWIQRESEISDLERQWNSR